MKRTLNTLVILFSLATSVCAADTLGVGVRAGAAAGRSSWFTEVFGDLYLDRLFSLGATVGYVLVDRDKLNSVKRDESLPITALFKLHAPLPLIKPYAGLGSALVFHDKRGVKGTPVALAGLDLGLGPVPLYLNIEYRRQFDDELDFISGGVAVRF
ncbi:MAG: hypothetical protein HYV06_03250 [Deltaproteobacteria bacterium]|nr:hypothetical protein [Deltaproteobacteria bacterium]